MKFTLRNLGRLREATIDLGKDVIILTGPNNTSKTYVAHTVYGFFETYFPKIQRAIQSKLVIQNASNDGIEVNVVESVMNNFDGIISNVCSEYERMLPRILACDPAFIATTRVNLQISEEQRYSLRQRLLEWSSEEKPGIQSSDVVWVKRAGDEVLFLKLISQRVIPSPSADDVKKLAVYASLYLSNVVMRSTLLQSLVTPQILVAERAAIQLFSKELSQRKTELVYDMLDAKAEEKSEIGLLEKRAKRYSLPIRDALEKAQDLAVLKRERSEFAPFADDLEKQLL